jgi:hypothetical protein
MKLRLVADLDIYCKECGFVLRVPTEGGQFADSLGTVTDPGIGAHAHQAGGSHEKDLSVRGAGMQQLWTPTATAQAAPRLRP